MPLWVTCMMQIGSKGIDLKNGILLDQILKKQCANILEKNAFSRRRVTTDAVEIAEKLIYSHADLEREELGPRRHTSAWKERRARSMICACSR